MKKFLNNNLKLIIGFMAGAIIFSGATYAVTLNFASGDVEHTKADGSKTTVHAAINELYGKAATEIQAAYNRGVNEGSKNTVTSFYKNNLTSTSGTLYSISCSAAADGDAGRWTHHTNSATNSVNIPLYQYDSSGKITAALNMVYVYNSFSRSGETWGGATDSASSSFTLQTNKGTTLGSGSASTTYPYNLFGMSGLDGCEYLVLSGSSYLDANINGANHGSYTVTRWASSSLSYSCQYLKVS